MSLSRRERREQRRKQFKEEMKEKLKSASDAEKVFQKKEYKGLLGIYDKYYLRLLVIPLIILAVSLCLVGYKLATTGEFINKGVALTGGITITVPVQSPVDIIEIKSILQKAVPGSEIDVRSATEFGVQKSIIIMLDKSEAEHAILVALEPKIPDALITASTETTGAALGGSFFAETTKAMIFAFIFMSIVVFISFRTFTPSIMVITCVLIDIVETVAAVNLLGVKFSGAGIAALLMLIGYSVDTDILLTSRVLRSKEGTVFERTVGAFKTGIMMTATAIVAVGVSLFLTQNETIKEIMLIILVGLIFDIINTWITNTALLRYYAERILPGKKAAKAAAAAKAALPRKKEDAETEKDADASDSDDDTAAESGDGPDSAEPYEKEDDLGLDVDKEDAEVESGNRQGRGK